MVPEYVSLPTGRQKGGVQRPLEQHYRREGVVPEYVGLPTGRRQGGVQRPLVTTL